MAKPFTRISAFAHRLVRTSRPGLGHTAGMKITPLNRLHAFALIALGLAIAAMSIYVAEVDDAPGGAVIGMLLMVGGVVLGVKAAHNRLPTWAARTALAIGVVVAALAASLTYGLAVTTPLFSQAQTLPSVVASTPSPDYTVAVERARELVRAAVSEQNLPGVSVAVGAEGAIVWAEGFGWRDVGTQTPVTPDTRFHIGTAASTVIGAGTGAITTLGLTNTGADAAKEWSPEAIGEEGEDFPPLTFLRHNLWQPLGLMDREYPLPGDRATFYVPRSDKDPSRGRRLMYMRDLACCANGMAFSSTPSDLVRFAQATNAASVNGGLAGGTVMSLITRQDRGLVIAVTSNIAYANTSELAQRIGDAFAEQIP